MQYFIDSKNEKWAFEDDVSVDVINQIALDNNLVFAVITEADYLKSIESSLTDLKNLLTQDIRVAFNAAISNPVDINGRAWAAGLDAIGKYKAALDLAELTGLDTVDIRDITGTPHTLSLADARTILIVISTEYFRMENLREDYILQVNAAQTVTEIESITITF